MSGCGESSGSTAHLAGKVTINGTPIPSDAEAALSIQPLGGGYIPFAKTKAQRLAAGDPRLSLEERYGTHDAYVARVKDAAKRQVAERFLLQEDADRLVDQAEKSAVLR